MNAAIVVVEKEAKSNCELIDTTKDADDNNVEMSDWIPVWCVVTTQILGEK